MARIKLSFALAKSLAEVLSHVTEASRHMAEDFCHVAEVFSQQFSQKRWKKVGAKIGNALKGYGMMPNGRNG